MADFDSAAAYAEHLMKRHKGDRRAAIAEVVAHHEINKQLRRDAIEILKETLPNWQIVFPHFPEEDMPDIPETWEDISWHNDACPSFMAMCQGPDGDPSATYEMMRVWVAEADSRARELPDVARFCVTYEGAADEVFEFQSEDWQEILDYVTERVELGEHYKKVVGYNPFLDEPRTTPQEVRKTLEEYEEEAKVRGEQLPKP